jgi:hypothetical protein
LSKAQTLVNEPCFSEYLDRPRDFRTDALDARPNSLLVTINCKDAEMRVEGSKRVAVIDIGPISLIIVPKEEKVSHAFLMPFVGRRIKIILLEDPSN